MEDPWITSFEIPYSCFIIYNNLTSEIIISFGFSLAEKNLEDFSPWMAGSYQSHTQYLGGFIALGTYGILLSEIVITIHIFLKAEFFTEEAA